MASDTPSQTDWAEKKADEILRRLDHRDVAYDTKLIAAALRAERERCGCAECSVANDIAREIREGE